jgi:hypothetical protein
VLTVTQRNTTIKNLFNLFGKKDTNNDDQTPGAVVQPDNAAAAVPGTQAPDAPQDSGQAYGSGAMGESSASAGSSEDSVVSDSVDSADEDEVETEVSQTSVEDSEVSDDSSAPTVAEPTAETPESDEADDSDQPPTI